MGSISERVYIKFASDDKPQEPTSTLVLTLPSGNFIDTRILRSASDCYQVKGTGISGYSKAVGGIEDLDWAFAGVSTARNLSWNEVRKEMERMKLTVDESLLSAITVRGGGDKTLDSVKETKELTLAEQHIGTARSCSWSHVIDSRVIVGKVAEALDQGIMFPTDIEGEELERGGMLNPTTSHWEDYEELWRDIGITNPPWMHHKSVYWCCELQDSEYGSAKAVFIRIGQYAQGILAGKGWVRVERWEADFERKLWNCVARVGSSSINEESRFHILLKRENTCSSRWTEIDGIRWEMTEVYS